MTESVTEVPENSSREEHNRELHHTDQSPPIEWHTMEYGGETFVVHDVPEGTARLFVVTGRTTNLRALASDGYAIYNGNIVSTHYNDERHTVEFVHDFAGTVGRHGVTEWLHEPVIRLKEIPKGSGDLMEATA